MPIPQISVCRRYVCPVATHNAAIPLHPGLIIGIALQGRWGGDHGHQTDMLGVTFGAFHGFLLSHFRAGIGSFQ
jgi:hypothetical protein